LSVPRGRSRKARLNPELGFPTWGLVELLSQPRRALPCAGRRRFSPASADNTEASSQLSLSPNLPGTKGSVPDPARSCREKLPCKRCLSLCSPSLARSLP
ncbi:hypothetical protein AS28_10434, partial [Pygoscelis adeliae]